MRSSCRDIVSMSSAAHRSPTCLIRDCGSKLVSSSCREKCSFSHAGQGCRAIRERWERPTRVRKRSPARWRGTSARIMPSWWPMRRTWMELRSALRRWISLRAIEAGSTARRFNSASDDARSHLVLAATRQIAAGEGGDMSLSVTN